MNKKRVGPATEDTANAEGGVEAARALIDNEEHRREVLEADIAECVAGVLQANSATIDRDASLMEIGFDSITLVELCSRLNARYGLSLVPPIFFEWPTIRTLGAYLLEEQSQPATGVDATEATADEAALEPAQAGCTSDVQPDAQPDTQADAQPDVATDTQDCGSASASEPIAVIGISGRYPRARTLQEFWDNLTAGRDCIDEVPRERWSLEGFYCEEGVEQAVSRGESYCKWGGFIDGFSEFDTSFFRITPQEAQSIDPQERLFLQCAYETLEDAGYAGQSLDSCRARIGVFVGVTATGFALYGPDIWRRGGHTFPRTSFSSIANRVSYFLNLRGPSIPLDTMCSASLTAIHEACEHILRGECDAALAGGVNIYLHPSNFVGLCGMGVLSRDGRCRSFGRSANGIVPGEGIGAVMLKRLSRAIRDGDHIHGLITGTSINHGGRTGGYSVPSPEAQGELVRAALEKARVHARMVSYIEAHGTGTELGDPIEIAGLKRAFSRDTADRQFCAIGSVKSNIGHSESAAGIAGLTKVLLQMKHRTLVPTLHAQELNPYIDFTDTPFMVQRDLAEWRRPAVEIGGQTREYPRIAGVSSFGVGGANAHVVLQEYVPSADARRVVAQAQTPVIIVLSAKDAERLKQRAALLLEAVGGDQFTDSDLSSIAYTLQVGRDAMEHRLAVLVESIEELRVTLRRYIAGEAGIERLHTGEAKRSSELLDLLADDDLSKGIDAWVAKKKYGRLLDLWVKGLAFEWRRLYGAAPPQRVSLPVYPFARDRIWLPLAGTEERPTRDIPERLHPLVQRNTSSFSDQRYSSTFTGREWLLRGRRIAASGVLPEVAYLEMVRAAVCDASGLAARDTAAMRFRDAVWLQPFAVRDEPRELSITLRADDTGAVTYEIHCDGEGETSSELDSADDKGAFAAGRVILAQGSVVLVDRRDDEMLDVATLQAECGRAVLSAEQCCEKYRCAGVGSGVESVHLGDRQALVKLRLPEGVAQTEEYVLHPSVLDSALQAAIVMRGTQKQEGGDRRCLASAVDEVEVLGRCAGSGWAWIRESAESAPGIWELDIDLCDEEGRVNARLLGLSLREQARGEESETVVLLSRRWQEREAIGSTGAAAEPVGKRQVVVWAAEWRKEEEYRRALAEQVGAERCGSLGRDGDEQQGWAQRYEAYGQRLLGYVQAALAEQVQRLQLVLIGVEGDQWEWVRGLAGLLKTAQQERPQLKWQVLEVSGSESVEAVVEKVEAEALRVDGEVSHVGGVRRVSRLEEVPAAQGGVPGAQEGVSGAQVPWKDGGVYLISGGAGGLGLVFAQEIGRRVRGAKVILLGRGELEDGREQRLLALRGLGLEVDYVRVDVSDRAAVEHCVEGIVGRHGRLDGVLHAAGVLRDSFVMKKSAAELGAVFESKVGGLVNLDEATAGLSLDFFIAFSSAAGVFGNVGQGDYAMANAFMDEYVGTRARWVEAGRRSGRSVSIAWPLWAQGGMRMEEESRAWMEAQGIRALSTQRGLEMFYRGYGSGLANVVVVAMRGDGLAAADTSASREREEATEVSLAVDEEVLREKSLGRLLKLFSQVSGLSVSKVDVEESLESYGIDSVMITALNRKLGEQFGALSKTLWYEYPTLRRLNEYLVREHRERCVKWSGLAAEGARGGVPGAQRKRSGAGALVSRGRMSEERGRKETRRAQESRRTHRRGSRFTAEARRAASSADSAAGAVEPIAVIGMSGRYPQARTLSQYWENLKSGRDCIQEIPAERWELEGFYCEGAEKALQEGKSYCKWGGFVDGFAEFDALFFNISPREAEDMDPQERLFMQTSWEVLEDAGYTRESLQVRHAGRVGVFAGITKTGFDLYGPELRRRGEAGFPQTSFSSVANRVSYFLDLHGPSMPIDTMCSASLTAIHEACEHLRRQECELAIAGGVNLYLHPSNYVAMCGAQMLSARGRCRSFGRGGDGMVPGEGVGAVLLKRLSQAERDGDPIYGLIRGTSINHGGKTNGYTVPNPQAQRELIRSALDKAGVNARQVSYIEAHGTGTQLGDPIEITGLTQAFEQDTGEKGFCALGSVKSNIGHAESAAGIAGVTKVLLQMKHGLLVPSLHVQELNENISFEATPFVIQRDLAEWRRPLVTVDGVSREYPRIAGISSFGAGGSNAHVVLEEYVPPRVESLVEERDRPPAIVVLSARDADRLRERVQQLLEALQSGELGALEEVAYTLQVGREAMEQRLAVLVRDYGELQEKLRRYVSGEEGIEDLHRGEVKGGKDTVGVFVADEELQEAIGKWIGRGKYGKLLDLWVKGLKVDWERLYASGRTPRRISLPTYPFARRRCWFSTPISEDRSRPAGSAQAPMHPLAQRNSSDLEGLRFSSTLTGEEFYLADHRVCGARVLPGAAHLEMARAAAESVGARFFRGSNDSQRVALSLRKVVWQRPLVIEAQEEVHIRLEVRDSTQLGFEIVREGADESAVVYCSGEAQWVDVEEERLDLAELRGRCSKEVQSGAECYRAFSACGIEYGSAHRALETIGLGRDERGERFALGRLQIPQVVADTVDLYVLHPSMLDGATQATIALLSSRTTEAALPFALEELRVLAPIRCRAWCCVREAAESTAEVGKFDIVICDDEGHVCARLSALSMRPSRQAAREEGHSAGVAGEAGESLLPEPVSLLLEPVWEPVMQPQWESSGDVVPAPASRVVLIGGTEPHRSALRERYPNLLALDVGVEHDIPALQSMLESCGPIEHLFWLAPSRDRVALDDERVIEDQDAGVVGCYRVIKALLALRYGSRPLGITVVTVRAQGVHPRESVDPTHASVHGLIGSLAKEYATWKVRLIDVDEQQHWPWERLLRAPADERGDAWCYRAGEWYRQVLLPCQAPELGEQSYRKGGVYVLIGGAGGLGEVFTEHLIRGHEAQVIWLGRRAEDAGITEKRERLGRIGPMPQYIQADVTDRQMLEKAYGQIKQRHGAIHGVVHTAIVLLDRSLLSMEEARFKSALAAKVDASVRLAQVFGREKLDFVLFFSSLQSMAKAPGQSNYAAGCTFKDAFAHQLRLTWSCEVKVMNWGYWGSVGVVASEAYRKRMVQAGIGSIDAAEGMRALDALVAGPYDQLAFSKGIGPLARDNEANVVSYCAAESPSVVASLAGEKITPATISEAYQEFDRLMGELLWAQLGELGLARGSAEPIEAWRVSAGVAEKYRRWLEESVRELRRRGCVTTGENTSGRVNALRRPAAGAWELWEKNQNAWVADPVLGSQVRLVDATLRALPQILRGEVPATSVMFPASTMGLVESVYKDNQVADTLNVTLTEQLERYVAERLRTDAGARLRLLEIGAGTGGTSKGLFEKLWPCREAIQEYCYTDLSRAFLLHAREHYAPRAPYLTYRIFDIERGPAEQSIEPGAYDVVIAANVLHATASIRKTVRNAKALLKRNGMLLLNEMAANSLFAHLTFGLLDGWWKYQDEALRIEGCPGLTPESWKEVLEQEGFRHVAFAEQTQYAQIIVAESDGLIRASRTAPLEAPSTAEAPGESQGRDSDGGQQPPHPAMGQERGVETLSKQVISERTRAAVRDCIAETLSLEGAEIEDNRNFSEYGVDSIIAVRLVNAINGRCQIDLPTTALFDYSTVEQLTAHIVKRSSVNSSASHGAPSGRAQAVGNGAAGRPQPRAIGNAATGLPQPARIAASTAAREVRAARFPKRQAAPSARPSTNGLTSARMREKVVIEGPKGIDALRTVSEPLGALEDHCVRVAIRAFSLNFSDVLCAQGLYPVMPPYPFTPGAEASGQVVEVGRGVTKFRPGDAVVAIIGKDGSHASVADYPENLVFAKPQGLSFEQACSLPIVGITVLDVFRKAQVQRGEWVLIQTATGGVGLVAIQLAKHCGAQIIATAGSAQKLAYLASLGVEHRINYRESDFEAEVKRITHGKGVDVVINTLAGDALQKGINGLSSGGRYVEIASFALKSARAIDLSVLSDNQSFQSVNIGLLAQRDPALIARYYQELSGLIDSGVVKPTLSKVFEFERFQEAYRQLQERKNIGKVVVAVPESAHAGWVAAGNERRSAGPGAEELNGTEPIAVVGMSGRFAQADSLAALWSALQEGVELTHDFSCREGLWGRDVCAVEAAKLCGRAGFLSDIEAFDASFFNISEVEATYMDPQQRVFLEEAYKALEHAGYAQQHSEGPRWGVYVGCANSDYSQLFGGEPPPQSFWGNAASLIPARVSYHLNLHGPAVAIDTACSSSLVAIHAACQALRAGEIAMALAGGVLVQPTPGFHLSAGRAGMLSPRGRCSAFDESADGFVPAEGVGVVVLKRLSAALSAADQIYGVIRGSGTNQDGATNGITAPSALSQELLERSVYERFGIDPERIGVVEAHGTGTKLGDPIEYRALTQAFRASTSKRGYCAIGSLKTNIGHAATAAGVAGVLKLLLSLQHRQIPPSLNFQCGNSHIDFEDSPFYVNTKLRSWDVEPGVQRIGVVSSFGFSGTNAHVVVQEAPAVEREGEAVPAHLVVLSGRTQEQLREQVRRLVAHCERAPQIDCGDISLTLLLGRRHLRHRLACVVRDRQELLELLGRWLARGEAPQVYVGEVQEGSRREQESLRRHGEECIEACREGADMRSSAERLATVAELYLQGYSLGYERLFRPRRERRIALPTYPFAKDRYWVGDEEGLRRGAGAGGSQEAVHPLVHQNVSDLSEQRYRSVFAGTELFLQEEVGGSGRVLPELVCLEMARGAFEDGACVAAGAGAGVELLGVRWPERAVVGDQGLRVQVGLYAAGVGEEVRYEIFSEGIAEDGERVVHSEGVLRRGSGEVGSVDLGKLLRGVEQGEQGYVVAELPAVQGSAEAGYVLHPQVLGGVLEGIKRLLRKGVGDAGRGVLVPQSVEQVQVGGACEGKSYAVIREVSAGAEDRQVEVQLCDESGAVWARLLGLRLREQADLEENEKVVLLSRRWQESEAVGSAGAATEPVGKRRVVVWAADGKKEEEYRRALAEQVGAERCGRLGREGDEQQGWAQRYEAYGQRLLGYVQAALAEQVQRLQLVLIGVEADQWEWIRGLAGLLKTAQQERPQLKWQVLEVSGSESVEAVVEKVEAEALRVEGEVSHVGGVRRVSRLEEVPAAQGGVPGGQESVPGAQETVPWKDGGVYLISGGAGGLGLVFAQEIGRRVRGAKVILLGRGELGEEREQRLLALRGLGLEVDYVRVDVSDRAAVEHCVEGIVGRHGRLDGVLHAAGVLRDSFVMKKSAAELGAVFESKVGGLVNLDEATAGLSLDFFIAFSSAAGVFGNVGQGDYAMANAFMDEYVGTRARWVEAGRRSGRSVSIAWPLWLEGGMRIEEQSRAWMEARGIGALSTQRGLEMFYRGYGSGLANVVVVAMRGDGLAAADPSASRESEEATEVSLAVDEEVLREKSLGRLTKLFAQVNRLSVLKVDVEESLERYGIDSVMIVALNRKLGDHFGELSKTLWYEYPTLRRLNEYLVREHRERCVKWSGLAAEGAQGVVSGAQGVVSGAQGGMPGARRRRAEAGEPVSRGRVSEERGRRESRRAQESRRAHRRWSRFKTESGGSGASSVDSAVAAVEPIAVIGMSGRYPQARTLSQYWENLKSGRDCIQEIPAERWGLEGFYREDVDGALQEGKSYCKWGGFVEGFAEFDALFFNISPREAEGMDPQERLFMHTCWEVLEDAGYTRESLQVRHASRVGVFAGITKTGFDLYGPELWRRGEAGFPQTSFSSVANRVSYFLDLHGPSMPIDTMCSASLTAIHEACEHLRREECALAIAGGVNLYLHPSNYVAMSGMRMLSAQGRCKSFGRGGDGMVPGEGVGAVLLKRLSEAERDGDYIYGLVRGTSINHGGKTNGYTVPNPQAQRELIRSALDKAGVNARQVSYIEAHGTGTELGDPIEIAGLTQAFEQDTAEKGFCALGSVKSNIGHAESAAGIAGVTKVLLQMKHGLLVPSLHVQELNENISFEATPFVIQRELGEWQRPLITVDGVSREYPRIAGISSFGAGGSNAHVVLEEYVPPRARSAVEPRDPLPAIVVLSARDADRLKGRVQQLLEALQSGELGTLEEVAYTLQVGREAMEQRLAVLVRDYGDLQEKLRRYVSGEEGIEELYRGEVKGGKDTVGVFVADEELQEAIGKWIGRGKYGKLLGLWVKGLKFDWERLYGESKPRRVPLPVYPFAPERYWVRDGGALSTAEAGRGLKAALHPLVHENVSDLSEQRYRSVFDGEEFFFKDHQVHGKRMLPGVAYLEMARAAVERAVGLEDRSWIELANVVWAQPVVMSGEEKVVHVGLTAGEEQEVRFEIYEEAGEEGGGERVVHSEGVAVVRGEAQAQAQVVDVGGVLRGEIRELSGEECYRSYEALGLKYGEAHRVLRSAKVGEDDRGRRCVVARLELPGVVAQTADSYVLHPSVLDGALHGMFGLWTDAGEAEGSAGRGVGLPYAVDRVLVLGRCARESYAVIRALEGAAGGLRKADIDVCDADGVLRVRLEGFSTREMPAQERDGALQSGERQGLPEKSGTHERVELRAQQGEEAQAGEAVQGQGGESLEERLERGTRRYLKRLISKSLKVGMERLEDEVSLERYGLESVLVLQMTRELEKVFGSLSKTLFFEYPSVKELSGYFVQRHREALLGQLGLSEGKGSAGNEGEKRKEEGKGSVDRQLATKAGGAGRRRNSSRVSGRRQTPDRGGIAIVGMSGRYPQARDLQAYWENLREGRDCITEIPASRWDHGRYFDEQKGKVGKSYSKWGGFIEGVEEFDALFFNISPLEAQFMDPQERLFLQCAYETLEDAGHTRERLRGEQARVGVFVGVMYEEYQLYGAQAQALGDAYGLGGNPSSIANRVSYFCDFGGPSLAVDTMCSSSLMAIHLACESLRRGECTAALAGGVNVSIHPNKYLVLSQTGFASSRGRCESFAEGGDGYVPGEGVGAVLLKRLEEAEEAGDQIHGVILGTSVNHGGKTNGYTVPNPQAQGRVIEEALRRAGVSAREVSYIEAHGTGTELGDPIEIAGLRQAFEQDTAEKGFCAIGSVKSNIGHAESAAGIAGVTKVLLQMKHGLLVPSLHAERLNPHIDFEATPFVVQRDLSEWKRPVVRIGAEVRERPRIAGVSSFGAGGSNAHVVLKEYVRSGPESGRQEQLQRPVMVVLSARDGDRLRERAQQLLAAVRAGDLGSLEEVGYTLQVGREAMEHRLALLVRTYAELEEKLGRYVAAEEGIEEVYRGEVKGGKDTVGVFVADEELQEAIGKWIERGKYRKLLEVWVKGLKLDWGRLYGEQKPRVVSLPVYPFARERHWVGDEEGLRSGAGVGGSQAALHPLVHQNVSDLSEQRYRSVFEGTEIFLREEVAGAGRMFPELACLEMARAAFEDGAGVSESAGAGVELLAVRWPERALFGERGLRLQVGLYTEQGVGEEVRYEIFSEDTAEDSERVVHSEGVVRRRSGEGRSVDLGKLLQGVKEGERGYVVAELSPQEPEADEGYVLHPKVLAVVLEAIKRLLRKGAEDDGGDVLVPEGVRHVEIVGVCEGKSYAVIREVSAGAAGWQVDVELCDESGAVWACLLGLRLREQAVLEENEKVVLLSRRWHESEAVGSAGARVRGAHL